MATENHSSLPREQDHWRGFVAVTIVGRMAYSAPPPVFVFERADGTAVELTAAEMREASWWRALPAEIMSMIEAHLNRQHLEPSHA